MFCFRKVKKDRNHYFCLMKVLQSCGRYCLWVANSVSQESCETYQYNYWKHYTNLLLAYQWSLKSCYSKYAISDSAPDLLNQDLQINAISIWSVNPMKFEKHWNTCIIQEWNIEHGTFSDTAIFNSIGGRVLVPTQDVTAS